MPQNQSLYATPVVFELVSREEGSLSCHICCDTGPRFFFDLTQRDDRENNEDSFVILYILSQLWHRIILAIAAVIDDVIVAVLPTFIVRLFLHC